MQLSDLACAFCLSTKPNWSDFMKHLLATSFITVAALVLSNTAAAQTIVAGSVYNDGACANTFAGVSALANNINTSSSDDCANVEVISTEGVANTAFGYEALLNNTTGSFNVGIGTFAATYTVSGQANVAVGYAAMGSPTTGSFNTAIGHDAMEYDGNGSNYDVALGAYAMQYNNGQANVAIGYGAMTTNTSGNADTAVGTEALSLNTTGYFDTALGYFALYSNTAGLNNTASGYYALYSNTTGSRNNAFGEGALQINTTANDNNAMGVSAMADNTTGALNNAMGNYALEYNTTGNNNNAVGYGALLHNTAGSDNSGQGYFSLEGNTTGNLNIGVGYKAGSSLTTGSNNIDIGNVGVAAEAGKIRIGTQGTQSAAFIAGVSGTNITGGAAVVVSSSGQLGVVSSSRRYKEDIQPMGAASERLYQLQPVTFRYKQPEADGQKPVQVGLIAEDVAAVMPELVVYSQDGQPESVAYHLLPTLLLNEVQKEHELVVAQARQLKQQDQRVAELAAQVAELQRLTVQLAAREELAGAKLAEVAQLAAAK
jgi:trimeric autotransporter adhesin